MKLKKLTIIGFKSFADKVSLDFDCEIVGIVGPNGCGKSNIVDAFRWVLGEQSAKSLRGDKMYDVLFAGTDSRKPLNMAEVSVTLTDIEGKLPIAYDEVTITRRLYRSGDSEYLINRQPVRLKDIQNLFLGSGIGKNTFSVFEQGKLDQVINLNPKERRAIFDEAAGIGRFLQRKKETVRKLSQVSENYRRVQTIHQEVEKQTKQLKKQATQAKNFQENKRRLEELERALLVTRWRTLSEKHRELEEALSRINQELREEQHRLEAIEKNVEETKFELKEQESRAKAEQMRLHKAETEAHVHEAKVKQQKQHLADYEKKQERVEEEREVTEAKLQALLKQIEEKRLPQQSLEKEKEKYEQCEKQMRSHRKELRAARDAHLLSLQEEGRLQHEIQEKKFRLQAEEQRLGSLKERIREKKEEQKRLKKESLEKQKEVRNLSKAIDKLKSECESYDKELFTLRKEVSEKQATLQECVGAITEETAREGALLRLKEACEGFSSGAKALLKHPPFKGKVRGLFEVLKPEKEMMPALQIYAQTLVLSSKKDLEEVLAFAEKKKLTDFSLVLLGKEPFIKGVRLFSDLKEALKVKKEGVSKEGYYLDQKGVIFHFNALHKEGNPFLREAELTALSKSLVKRKKEQKTLQAALETLLEKQKEVETKGREVTEKRRKQEMGHVQENFALQRLRSDLEKNEKALTTFEEEQKTLAKGKKESEGLKKLSEQLVLQQKQSQTLLTSLKGQEEAVERTEASLQTAMKRWQEAQGVYQEINILQATVQQSRELLKKLEGEAEELSEQISQMRASIEQQASAKTTQTSLLLELEKTSLKEEAECEKSRAKREELEKTIADKRARLSSLEKKQHHLEITFAEDAAERKGVEHELLERHHLPPEQLDNCVFSLDEELEEAEKQVMRLRVSIEEAGAVNMTAIDEYQEQASRYQELDRQLVDLEEGKKDLEKIIGKLDGESRKIFKETFEKIRENFRKNFAILFNGGEANLTFTESPDVLEAGIEIVAKPPGKQMRSISLLSGGEKCLTALALLFSIFEVLPAPFCILDEVDAPLDDSNIERFTNVLQQYIDKTQFIVVTHNKKTMAIADLLLGVSMEEKGISKLISLAFSNAALAEKA